MIISLPKEHAELLAELEIPYDPEKDYDSDALMALEDAITDYVLYYEISKNGTTELGNQLLGVHYYIVKHYDS